MKIYYVPPTDWDGTKPCPIKDFVKSEVKPANGLFFESEGELNFSSRPQSSRPQIEDPCDTEKARIMFGAISKCFPSVQAQLLLSRQR